MVVSASHFKDVTNGYEKRTDGLWTHTGKFVVRQGPVELPAGSIGTVELEAGAAQAQIGSYVAGTAWSTTTTGSWLATAILTGSIACSGALCRIEVSTGLAHTVAAGIFYSGLMVDGALAVTLAQTYAPFANAPVSIAWTWYYTPAAGNRTFALCVYNATAGTLATNANITSTLYVTEQRR